MIDYDNKLIFVHMPKTGGSSVEALLLDKQFGEHKKKIPDLIKELGMEENFPGGHHSSLQEQKDHVKKMGLNPHDFMTFTIIRNPWARVVSNYKYHIQHGYIPSDTQFDDDYFQLKPFTVKSSFSNIVGKREDIDYILLFEELSHAFELMFMNRGKTLENKLPHTNASKDKTHYSKFFEGQEHLIKMVKAHHKFESRFYEYEQVSDLHTVEV